MSEPKVVDIALADIRRLEDVVTREALTRVCRSFFDLFGLSIHVFSRDGSLLADAHEERSVCKYVNTLNLGRAACAATVSDVKEVDPTDGTVLHPCFTGAIYRIVPILYQGRRVGRIVIGPYLPAETLEVPPSLLEVDPHVEPQEARDQLAQMPRVRADTANRIAEHMQGVIDLLLFSSHRAHLTSEMHVQSVREGYRELAENNARLQEAYDRLKELDRLKSNFLATVSHELRTPLTSIIGYSEMLAGGMAGPLSKEQAEFVHTIHEKGDHLLALISSLLDLSKLEQGNLPLRIEAIDPRKLLEEISSTIAPQAVKKSVTVEIEAPATAPSLAVDPVRIRQVLINLADNAVKFTPEGGTVRLEVSAAELEGEEPEDGLGAVLLSTPRVATRFVVSDTGIGIPRGELTNIFEAFYQVDGSSTREHGGTGLGLAIAKRLTEAHGGDLRVESTIGKGTRFIVLIPEPEGGSAP